MLELTNNRILASQLKLLQGNIGTSVIPGILVALLLVWTLANDSNAQLLQGWCALVITSKLSSAYYARWSLKSGVTIERARQMVWWLMLIHAVDGLIWGLLAWVALGSVSAAGSVLVIAVLAGVAGNSMSLLSPVLPVFVAFLVPEIGALALKLWRLGDVAYHALGLASVLYIITLLAQSKNSNLAAKASIALRFENLELIDRLQQETKNAQASHQTAEAANQAKSRFLAAASHDLRQPIHAQGLFLTVLSQSELTDSQRNVVDCARSASQASADMLNTLLDFSRIEAGIIEPQVRPLHLQYLLNKIEIDLAPQADIKSLIYRSRDTHMAVQSDPVLLELILRNLVSNAIRYTKHGGVLVACRKRGYNLSLEIWDTGIGIAPHQQHEIFQEYFQLGNTERDRNKGLGLGLGLAIAQGFANILGHKLSLSSVLGRGSVFRLELPITNAVVISNGEERQPYPARAGLQHVRILVIDDDPSVREGMLYLLQGWGFECDVADSIEQALAQARIQPPDMVISDYRLRNQRTGAEAIAMLRDELEQTLLALLITGDTAPERLREARASGIPLLHKPVSPDQLYRRIESMLHQVSIS
jgi:signal transduction histidine kinase/CheY-like chemotaxis protein